MTSNANDIKIKIDGFLFSKTATLSAKLLSCVPATWSFTSDDEAVVGGNSSELPESLEPSLPKPAGVGGGGGKAMTIETNNRHTTNIGTLFIIGKVKSFPL